MKRVDVLVGPSSERTETAMTEYSAPSSEVMARRQNEDAAIRLLLAQRRLYSRAKLWQGSRWIGLLILGVAAPFVSLFWPSSAVAVGAITGLWLFIGRTALAWAEIRTMTKAAAVQEEFDLYVFGMPRTIVRMSMPSLEDIAHLTETEEGLRSTAMRENLFDWYPIDPVHPGASMVAIAQRANASYTDRLIRTAVWVWAAATSIWLMFLIILGGLSGLTFGVVLLGVVFPVLPAVLDVLEYLRSTWRAAQDRSDIANTIQARLEDRSQPIAGHDLLSWQVQMYDLRRSTPQLPDWLYRLSRRRNEAAMHMAARQLGET
jgi:hypothetical protein